MSALATFAWFWILLGLLSGVGMGLFFHDERWLGGYGSWERRMVRLGHISFFGTGLLCLMLAVTRVVWPSADLGIATTALIGGAVAMPTVCLLAAWRKPARHLFFIPVLCLLAGVASTVLVGGFDAVEIARVLP